MTPFVDLYFLVIALFSNFEIASKKIGRIRARQDLSISTLQIISIPSEAHNIVAT